MTNYEFYDSLDHHAFIIQMDILKLNNTNSIETLQNIITYYGSSLIDAEPYELSRNSKMQENLMRTVLASKKLNEIAQSKQLTDIVEQTEEGLNQLKKIAALSYSAITGRNAPTTQEEYEKESEYLMNESKKAYNHLVKLLNDLDESIKKNFTD